MKTLKERTERVMADIYQDIENCDECKAISLMLNCKNRIGTPLCFGHEMELIATGNAAIGEKELKNETDNQDPYRKAG